MTLYPYGELQGCLCTLTNMFFPRGIPDTYPDHFADLLKWNLSEDIL